MKTQHLVSLLSILLTAAGDAPAAPGDTNGLLLNFNNVPLRAVLDYLSDKAGLIVVSEGDVRGALTVTARQPVSTAEAVSLLNDQLGRNHYTALLDGRTLTVMESARARTDAQTPVFTLTNPAALPVNNRIVTAIVPLHTLNPAQLVKDLEPLIPPGDTVTANEAGNAVLMTASQKDIHRLAAIITALDSTAVSEINVFALNHADAKSVAEELKSLFQSADAQANRPAAQISFGPRFGRPGGDNSGGTAKEKTAPTRAVFVADEQMNAVAASAPPDYMPMIARVVSLLDRSGEDVTEAEIFPLRHADPAEVVEEITALFAPPAASVNAEPTTRTAGFRFGGPGGLPAASPAATESSRLKRQATVNAVADRRTQSVIVTAAANAMAQIKKIIARLDKGNSGVMKVSVVSTGDADAATVLEALTVCFGSPNSTAQRQAQITMPLDARFQAQANSQATLSSTGSAVGTSGGASGLH
jgi:type II secretory pathway component GspD/PulD (secretin)